MECTKSVSVSGYLLSSLLYEHSSSSSDQEGFLIGDVLTHQIEVISDNPSSQKKEEVIINVYSHVPCQDVYSFYNFDGSIKIEKVEYYLREKLQDVVGWYRFRRHTPLAMSLRERAIHKNLCSIFPHGKKFTFGLFSSYVSENTATHTFDQIFFFKNILKEGIFEPITLNIVNLQETAHDDYRRFPRAPVNTKTGSYCEVAACVRGEDQVQESILLAEDINNFLLDKIEGLVEQVSSSEAEIGFLALDIGELEEKISKLLPNEVPVPVPVQSTSIEFQAEGAKALCKSREVTEEEFSDFSKKQDNTEFSSSSGDEENASDSPEDEFGCARTNIPFHKDSSLPSQKELNKRSC